MSAIPSGVKFMGISADVPTQEKRSALSNSYQDYYSIKDIYNLDFKPGSIGEKVSFSKSSDESPNLKRDIIIPDELEITRDNNGGGIYNIAQEEKYSNGSPYLTYWNTQYIDATNTSWANLWDIENRSFNSWRNASETPEGRNAPAQYVGMKAVMKYDNGEDPARYWLILFTNWGVGEYGEQGAFAYDRWEIFPTVSFTKENYDDTAVDIISDGVHIKRDNNGPLYNVVSDPYSVVGVSPRNTKWNSIYTDSRSGYYGFDDLNNLESRVYTDFALALDYNIGNNIIGTDLIMHDLTTDLYYKVTFDFWQSGNNGGGFTYYRTVIPQSLGVKLADGTILNNSTSQSSQNVDANGNLIVADNSSNTVNVGNGEAHLIDNFSGMLMVNDHYDGRVETWIAGGGDGVLLGYTNVGSGPCNSTLTMASGGYEWTNVDNMTGPFTFTVIKTRNSN